jgi:Zn-dependent peptidase ImmA (M78 family)
MIEPNYKLAKEMARKVLKDHKIISIPTDLVKIFDKLGLQFIELDDPKDIDGAIIEIDGKPKIAVLNKAKSISRQRFTLAHELGHIFLNHNKRDFYEPVDSEREVPDLRSAKAKPPKEIEADVFAAELLIPYQQLKKYQDSINDLENISKLFQVSKDAMAIAINNYWRYVK